MTWYLDDPVRYRVEREALEALAASADWLHVGEWAVEVPGPLRLVWTAKIATPHKVYDVTLRYPSHFPNSPPLVLPPPGSERWSSHQYGADGELCTEIGADNWQIQYTGADMIRSAYKLLLSEDPASPPGQEVASRHAVTDGQRLRASTWRMMATPWLREAAMALPDYGHQSISFASIYMRGCIVYVPYSFLHASGTAIADLSVPEPIRIEDGGRKGLLIRWPEGVSLPSSHTALTLRSAASDHGADASDLVVIVFVRRNDICAFHMHTDDSTELFALVEDKAEQARVPAEYAGLSEKRVALVGCGSIGSKIAVMLARAGVGKFLLVDDDILLPSNLVRHDLDWREIGAHKSASLARRIKLASPAAVCESKQMRLGGQESSGSVDALLSNIATCDLIIDATAEPGAFNYLSAASSVGVKPLLWAEVFGGGYGGLVARHRPGLEPKPMAMRSAIENWCIEQGHSYPKPAGRYGNETDSAPMIATDADVSVIAAHAARLAEDTLLGSDASQFPNSVYLVGLKKEWIFKISRLMRASLVPIFPNATMSLKRRFQGCFIT